MTLLKKELAQTSSKKKTNPQPVVKKTKPAVNPATASRKPVKAYPVVVRKKTAASARQAAGTQPRRKVYYSVAENGVETRLPAIPIIRFSWQWISGIMVLVLFVFTILLINAPMFTVDSVVVHGLTRYTEDDFKPLLTGKGTSIFLFDRKTIRNSIVTTYPELLDLSVNVSMPNKVELSASERQPVIMWIAGDQQYWVDIEGVVMTPRGESPQLLTIQSSTPPPLVKQSAEPEGLVDYALQALDRTTNPDIAQPLVQRIDPDVLYTIISMYAAIPEGAALVFDPISGMGWRDPGGWEVYFGTDLTNIGFKMTEYLTILNHLQELGVTPVMISVEHVDAPYFRTE